MPTFFLDDLEVPFTFGQTILDAALSNGHYIPHLCFRPELEPHSSCRLCTIRINGRPFASCTQPAMAGQRVECDTPELTANRLALTQMLFVEGNHYCPSCESGQCKLQATGYLLGMQDSHFPHQFPVRGRDLTHPEVALDRDRCIRCEICVRASRTLDGKNVFGMHGRGKLDGKELTEGLLNHIEVAIRAYDPCLSCATHALGSMALDVVLQDASGRVVDRLTRNEDGALVRGDVD